MILKEMRHFHKAVQIVKINICQEEKKNQFKKSKLKIFKI